MVRDFAKVLGRELRVASFFLWVPLDLYIRMKTIQRASNHESKYPSWLQFKLRPMRAREQEWSLSGLVYAPFLSNVTASPLVGLKSIQGHLPRSLKALPLKLNYGSRGIERL